MPQPRQTKGISTGGEYAAERLSEPGFSLAAPWPAISYEKHPWDAEPEPGASRRSRLLVRDPYQAAVLQPISGADPQIDSDTQAMVEAATVEMVRFDAQVGDGTGQFASLLLRSESASSSEIENLTAGARKIALAHLGDTSSPNARLIDANAKALQAALDLSDELSVENVAAVHEALLRESRPDLAGHYREAQVWIRGRSPHSAEFAPPHHSRVPAAMDDLVGFMRRDNVPALTQAAIAHAQFETIHPFADGNGRTGRAIVSSLLRAKGITEKVTIPISSGLLTDTAAYFATLTDYREGDPQPIVRMFAESTFSAIDNGRRLVDDITEIKAAWENRSLTPSARKLLDVLVRESAVSAEMLAERAGVTVASTYRAVDSLEEAGILKPAGKVRGRKVWIAPEVIDALDAFAIRAGRRSNA